MRRRAIAAAACCATVAACADVLGIDDGLPRAYDASIDVSIGDASNPDVDDASLSDGAYMPLFCGQTTCNFAIGEGCCRTGTTYQCVDAAATCTGIYIPCDRPAYCPTTDAGPMQCCATDVVNDAGQSVAQSVACKPTAQCLPIPSHYVLCDDDSSAECPIDASCSASVTTLPTFLICR